jgi:hypothetical protein
MLRPGEVRLRRREVGLEGLLAAVAEGEHGIELQFAQVQCAHLGAAGTSGVHIGTGQGGAVAVIVRVTQDNQDFGFHR